MYLVCFDLGVDLKEQLNQLTYWLDYLNSILSSPEAINDPESKKKWSVMIVGLGSDNLKPSPVNLSSSNIPVWQATWPNLPLYHKLFSTSKFHKYLSFILYYPTYSLF